MDFSDTDLVMYRRNQVGFVFRFINLVPTLTAEENIQLPMRFASKSGTDRDARTKELLQLVDLENRGTHRPDELSGGKQQRIALATAFANDAPSCSRTSRPVS